MQRATRACGLMLAGLMINCGSGGGGASDSRERASWDADSATCSLSLHVVVRGKVGARASVLGKTIELEGGRTDLNLPEAEVGDAQSLSIEIDEGGSKRTVEYRVLAKPEWPAHRVLPPGGNGTWLGKVEVSVGGRKADYYAHVPYGDDGVLAVPLPCGATAATSEQGAFARADSGPVLEASVVDAVTGRSKISAKDELELSAKVELAGLGAAEVTAKGPLPFASLVAGVRKVREAPLAWAAEYAKGKKQPVLIAYPSRLDFSLVGDAPLRDVAAIALVDPINDYLGECGPFAEMGGSGKKGIMAPHIATHASVTIVEARTGKQLATTTIKNRDKKCPEALVVEGYEQPTAAHPMPTGDVAKWVRKAVK